MVSRCDGISEEVEVVLNERHRDDVYFLSRSDCEHPAVLVQSVQHLRLGAERQRRTALVRPHLVVSHSRHYQRRLVLQDIPRYPESPEEPLGLTPDLGLAPEQTVYI